MDNMNLKAYLATVGMTMTEFCEKIRCQRTYLSTICSGKAFPGHRLARDIFTATNGVINLSTRPKRQKRTNDVKCEEIDKNVQK